MCAQFFDFLICNHNFFMFICFKIIPDKTLNKTNFFLLEIFTIILHILAGLNVYGTTLYLLGEYRNTLNFMSGE